MGQGDPSPFTLEGGDVGVLLIHGYTGSPAEMRRLGGYFNERGLTVMAPLLPGHGTRIEDANAVAWTDWTATVEQALADLRQRCATSFVAGLSMGGLLTLYLASRHPDLPGVIAYAPAIKVEDWRLRFLPIFKRFFKTMSKDEEHWADPEAEALLWSYDVWPVGGVVEVMHLRDEVETSLPRVTCPTMVVYSVSDPLVTEEAAQMVLDGVGCEDKTKLPLVECGHVMTVDAGWDELAEQTYQFIMARVPEAAAGDA
jgi:carboxylesterase